MSHTIPQLQSIFSRMMQLVGRRSDSLYGAGNGRLFTEKRITLSKPLARSHDVVNVVLPTDDGERKRGPEK
jgi:hypothetical protein